MRRKCVVHKLYLFIFLSGYVICHGMSPSKAQEEDTFLNNPVKEFETNMPLGSDEFEGVFSQHDFDNAVIENNYEKVDHILTQEEKKPVQERIIVPSYISQLKELSLNFALSKCDSLRMLETLLQHKVTPNASPLFGISSCPLSTAIYNKNYDAAKLLLQYHASPNGYFSEETPLTIATFLDHIPLMQLLLEHKASLGQAFYYVQSTHAIDLLLKHDKGALNKRNQYGIAPLDALAKNPSCSVDLLSHMVKRGALLYEGNSKGNTIAHFIAACSQTPKDVKELTHFEQVQCRKMQFIIRMKCPVNSENMHGITPLELAVERGFLNLAALLLYAKPSQKTLIQSAKKLCEFTFLHMFSQETLKDFIMRLITIGKFMINKPIANNPDQTMAEYYVNTSVYPQYHMLCALQEAGADISKIRNHALLKKLPPLPSIKKEDILTKAIIIPEKNV